MSSVQIFLETCVSVCVRAECVCERMRVGAGGCSTGGVGASCARWLIDAIAVSLERSHSAVFGKSGRLHQSC